MEFEITIKDTAHLVKVDNDQVIVNNTAGAYDFQKNGDHSAYIRLGNRTFYAYDIQVMESTVSFAIDGVHYEYPYKDEQALLLAKMGFKSRSNSSQSGIKSPMPGKILAVRKQIGDTVVSGETVIVLEAMKMENELKSHVNGVISAVHVEAGRSVEKNTLLLEIE